MAYVFSYYAKGANNAYATCGQPSGLPCADLQIGVPKSSASHAVPKSSMSRAAAKAAPRKSKRVGGAPAKGTFRFQLCVGKPLRGPIESRGPRNDQDAADWLTHRMNAYFAGEAAKAYAAEKRRVRSRLRGRLEKEIERTERNLRLGVVVTNDGLQFTFKTPGDPHHGPIDVSKGFAKPRRRR